MCFTLNQHGGHSPFSPLFPGPAPQNISLEPRKHDRHPSKCFVQLRYTSVGQTSRPKGRASTLLRAGAGKREPLGLVLLR